MNETYTIWREIASRKHLFSDWKPARAMGFAGVMLMTSKLEHAQHLADLGFAVFPLNHDCKPIHKGWQESASCDFDDVIEMWTDATGDEIDYNIGIATGRLFKNTGKYLGVFDLDVKNGKRGDLAFASLASENGGLPQTMQTNTASGGRHDFMLCRKPVPNSVGKIADGVDVRGNGGYVVAPGSEKNGRPYTFSKTLVPCDCPEWLEALAGKAKPKTHVAGASMGDVDSDSNVARGVEWLKTAASTAVEGEGGDNQTITVINRVGDFGISEEKAYDLLLEHWNEEKAIPPWDVDELRAKVASAYKSRQNAIGILDPSVAFDPVKIDESKPHPRRGLYVVAWEDAEPVLDQPYLIDDVLGLGSMVVTYGDSNVGKTYVVLDQARCIAAGVDWNGHKVKQGLVVYIAAEGGKGFFNRIAAFRKHYGAGKLPFALVPCPIDLHSSDDAGDTNRLIRLIKAEEAHFGLPCVLLVVDTLARAMGGGDENTSVDMGHMVRHCDKIRVATGATVNLIHHTGKDKAKGARGSSALRAATDTEIEVRATKAGLGELCVTKQRDMERAGVWPFALRGVEVGCRSDGRPVTGCVVEWRASASDEFEPKLSEAEQRVLAILEGAFAEEVKAARSGHLTRPQMVAAIQAKVGQEITLEAAKERLKRTLPTLIEQKLVKKLAKNQYVSGSVNGQGR